MYLHTISGILLQGSSFRPRFWYPRRGPQGSIFEGVLFKLLIKKFLSRSHFGTLEMDPVCGPGGVSFGVQKWGPQIEVTKSSFLRTRVRFWNYHPVNLHPGAGILAVARFLGAQGNSEWPTASLSQSG